MAQANTVVLSRLPPTFASLRYPNFRRWFAGQILSLAGTWMQAVAQGWLVYELTGSKLALGTISFAGSIPTLFLMLPAGVIADRVPKRKLLIWSQVGAMLSAFALAALSLSGVLQVWHIAVLAFFLGVVNSFDAPARMALTPELVEDRRDLQNAIALGSMMFNLARIIGPAIGGLVLAQLGASWCFVLNGVSFFAVLLALLTLRLPRDVGNPDRTRRMTAELGEGLRYIWHSPITRTLVLLIGITNLFGFSYAVLLPAYAADVLKVGEAGYGYMNAAVGVGALIGSLAVASLSRSRYRGWHLTLGSFMFPLSLILFSTVRSFPLALVALALVGLGFVTQSTNANTMVQTLAPDHLRGRVMAVYSFMFFGTSPFGSLLSGAVAQAWGPVLTIMAGASACLICAAGVFLLVPAIRKPQS